MMRKWFSGGLLMLAAALTAGEAADNPAMRSRAAAPGGGRERGRMIGKSAPEQELSPEERQRRETARKRRFEIMVLLESCRIMPEADREPLRRELMKRIEEDLRQALEARKQKLAEAEKDLENLRRDVAEREKNASVLAGEELERLLRLPPPWRRGPMRQNGAKALPPDSFAPSEKPAGK